METVRQLQWLQNEFNRETQLYLLDHFLCLFFVTPLIVGYYKGIFFILDHRFLLDDIVLKLSVVGIFGYGSLFTAYLCQHLLHPLSQHPREPPFHFVSRIYNLVIGLANTFVWYFVWTLSHSLLASHLGGVLRTLVLASMIIMCLRSYPSVTSVPPFYFQSEEPSHFFQATTIFKCKPSRSLLKFTLDAAFSVFVIFSVVVLIWKNTWTLLDLGLYPKEFKSTTVASLIIGYSFTIAAYALQTTAWTVANRLHSLPRIIFLNCWLLFTGFACINLWRGIWYIPDLFFDVESYGSWLPVTCLLLLQTFFSDNALATKGVLVEHQFFPEKAQVIFFPISYFQTTCEITTTSEKKQSVKLLSRKEEVLEEKPPFIEDPCAKHETQKTLVTPV